MLPPRKNSIIPNAVCGKRVISGDNSTSGQLQERKARGSASSTQVDVPSAVTALLDYFSKNYPRILEKEEAAVHSTLRCKFLSVIRELIS